MQSQQLAQHIAHTIEAQEGWIPFEQFMQLALYSPVLGYYSGARKKFGAGGDFVTAPEISPLFGQCLATQLQDILATLPNAAILELGAGRGRLARDLLSHLQTLHCLPVQYAILEVSASLREIQREYLQSTLSPELFSRVVWLDTLPQHWHGAIIGNEVLDAIPCRWVERGTSAWLERGVSHTDAGFFIATQDAEGLEAMETRAQDAPLGYTTEYNPSAETLIKTLADILQQGVMFWIDYGFPAQEYYHPQRHQGTLMCHYQQRAHDDVLRWPGLQDITAHVDFTAMALAGVESGLQVSGYTSQAQFLINCGITELLSATDIEDAQAYLPRVAHAQKLLSPAEMGELFKVLALSKAFPHPLRGFQSGDRTHVL